MNRGKIKKIFAMAVISGTLMVGAKNTAYAVITDYAIKLDNQVYSYNKSQLEESFLNYKAGEDAKLYEDFHSKLGSSKGFYAFKDDKKGFVSYEAIEKGFLKSKDDKKSFDVEKFVENDKSESLEVKETKEVVVNDKGSLEVKENKQDTAKDSKIESNEQKGSPDSSSSSKGSSSRGSSSSSSSRSSSSRGGSSSAKGSKEVKKEEVAKKPEVVPNEEEKKPEVNKEKIQNQPEIKREEREEAVKKPEDISNNENKENSMAKRFEESIHEGSKRVVEEVIKPEAIVSKTKGNVSIKSEITQTSQKPYMATYQKTTILVDGEAKQDITIELVGQNIEIKKGDDSTKVVDKIYNKFKGNEDWDVKFNYGQWGGIGNITFTSKKTKEHVDININNQNGLIFKVKNEQFGELAIAERKEVCTVTVLNEAKQKETMDIKVESKVVRKVFGTVSVQIEAGDNQEKIAEKIITELNKNEEINRYFKVEKNKDKIVFTQKGMGDKNDLEVTIKKENEEKAKVQDERERADVQVNPSVSEESEKVKKQQAEEERQAQAKKDREAEEAKVRQQQEEAERLRVQRENEERQQAELQKQQEAAEREKREKEAQDRLVEENTLQIESRRLEAGSIVSYGSYQTGNLAFKLQGQATAGLRENQEAKLTKDQTARILDRTIEFKAGDGRSEIKSKILEAFKGHKDWLFEVGFVVIENHGASVKYTCNKIQEDVYGEEFAKNTDEIEFIQSNERSGEVGKPEVKEKLEIAVKKPSNKKTTVNISIKIQGMEKEQGNVNVEIEAQDSVDKIAQKIATALKGNRGISKYYKIEVQDAKVILTQNMATKNQTDIIIKIS